MLENFTFITYNFVTVTKNMFLSRLVCILYLSDFSKAGSFEWKYDITGFPLDRVTRENIGKIVKSNSRMGKHREMNKLNKIKLKSRNKTRKKWHCDVDGFVYFMVLSF